MAGVGGLEQLGGGGVHAEGLLDDGARDVGLEDLVGGEQQARVLRVQRVERDGGLVAHVELEVQQRAREQDHVALLQRGGVQHVVVAHEARVDGALEHEQRLGRARVRVQRHHAADGEVQAAVREALRVEARELHGRGDDGRGARGRLVHVAAGLAEAPVDEVIGGHGAARLAGVAVHEGRRGRQIRHAEVLQGVGVRGLHKSSSHEQQHGDHQDFAPPRHCRHNQSS